MTAKSIYEEFDRTSWRALATKTPMPLTQEDLRSLAALGDPIDLEEADAVYRPLSALLRYRVLHSRALAQDQQDFFGRPHKRRIPFIIGVAGSVAVGKSTTARILQNLLSRWPETSRVALVTTDGFLYPNAELERAGLMARKGFPESYNRRALLNFVSQVKAGAEEVEAPVYSHVTYDVVPGKFIKVASPDVLILEGINVLQPAWVYRGHQDLPNLEKRLDQEDGRSGLDDHKSLAVSDFFDFSIYVDAKTCDIEKWFIERFVSLKESAFQDPESYFQVYAGISDSLARQIAHDIWTSINLPNLEQQIRPTRGRATLILRKDASHRLENVYLRKI